MTEEKIKMPDIIDEILKDLFIYLEPEVLKEEFKGFIDISLANTDGIKKYRDSLFIVKQAWQKILRYPQYFEDFYPSTDKIEKFEALNHHIHAYLQDIIILKNKIETLLGEIKNDVKKTASNKQEIDDFFKSGVEKTEEVFGKISKHRNPHHHGGRRFSDNDLLKAENAHGALDFFSNPMVDASLNPEYKPKILAKFVKEKEESFDIGKTRWIQTAQRNNKQVSGYLNALLDGIRPTLYQFLKIKLVNEVVAASEKKI